MAESKSTTLTDQMMLLIKSVGELAAKVDTVQVTLKDMKDIPLRLQAHDSRLQQIEESLKRGNQKFEKYDERIDALERKEGERSTDILKKIGYCALIAIVSAIISNIPTIIQTLAK